MINPESGFNDDDFGASPALVEYAIMLVAVTVASIVAMAVLKSGLMRILRHLRPRST